MSEQPVARCVTAWCGYGEIALNEADSQRGLDAYRKRRLALGR